MVSQVIHVDGSDVKAVFTGLGLSIFCANAGFLAFYTFIPIHARMVGASMSEIGLLLATYSLVSTIMITVFGRLSDIGGLRRLFIVAGFGGCALTYWLLTISRDYTQLLLLCFLLGIVDSAYRPTSVAVIAEITPRVEVGRGIGFFNAFMSAGMASGSLVGGKIADLYGLPSVFTFSSLLLTVGAVSSLVVLKLRVGSSTVGNVEGNVSRGGFASGFIVTSGLLTLCVDVFLRNCGFRGVTTYLPIFLTSLGAENLLTGFIISVNFLSQIFFMPFMGWLSDKVGRKHVLSVGMLATTLATFLLSYVKDPIEVVPIQMAVGFSWASITVASNAFAADIAPPGRLGEMMGIVLTSMNLGGVVGPVIGGFISERLDLRSSFRVLALFPMVSFIISARLVGRPRGFKGCSP
ncbi:MAG: MFS transporter [Candidatus Bathyarchaeia archaeon]